MHAIGEEKWAEFQESQGQKFRNHQRCLHRFSLKDKRNSTFPSTTYLKIACLVPSQSLCSYPHVSHFFNGENWVSIPHRRDHRFHLVRFWWLFRSTKHRVILPPSQGWLLPCYTTKYIYILPVYLYIYILYYQFTWDYHHPKQGALISNKTTPRQRATDDRRFHRCAGGKKTGTIHEMEIPQCSLVHELGINIWIYHLLE